MSFAESACSPRTRGFSVDRDLVIAKIIGQYRLRRTFLSFEIALQNQLDAKRREITRPPGLAKWSVKQANAIIDRTPELQDLVASWEPTHQLAIANHHVQRLATERELRACVKLLPVAGWVDTIPGFGLIGLSLIIGECGDLDNYATPAKVWKRMGLGVREDGTRQRRVAGTTLEEALAIGFCPRRRALSHVIGESLLRGNGDGAYHAYYTQEKERQLAKFPDPVIRVGEDGKKKDIRKLLAHRRALRHMEKRLLRNLWREWHHQSDSNVVAV